MQSLQHAPFCPRWALPFGTGIAGYLHGLCGQTDSDLQQQLCGQYIRNAALVGDSRAGAFHLCTAAQI